MVSWWPFDELAGPVAHDIAGFPNDGTYVGAPTPGVAVVQQGLAFDGVDDYVAVPNQSELNLGIGNFSIDAWVKLQSPTVVHTILDKRSISGSVVTGYLLFVSAGHLCLQLADGTATNYSSNLAVADGLWHHVAVTVERGVSTGIRWYLDGNLSTPTQNPTAHQGSLTNSSPLLLGKNAGPSYWLYGALDEVEIFNRVLSPQEIQGIFDAYAAGKCKCVNPPKGMKGWWPFDEQAGPVAYDIVGYPNDGTYVGAPTPVAAVVQWGLAFNGVNDYVEVPDQPELNLGTGDFSIDAWVFLETGNANAVQTILDKRSSAGGWRGYLLFVDANNHLCLQLADGTHTNYWSDVVVTPGQWHHVAVTVARASPVGIKWYLDGSPIPNPDDPTSHLQSLDNSSSLLLGKNAGTGFWLRGALDEVEIFDRVLFPQEIQGIFDANRYGKCFKWCYGNLDLAIRTGPSTPWLITKVPGSGSTLLVGPAPVSASCSAWETPSNANVTWVGTPCNGATGAGPYVYEYTFCLCAGYSKVEMQFLLWVDDTAQVFLNNWPIGTASACLGPGSQINDSSANVLNHFVVGVNTLRIEVLNSGGPSGMMVSGWIGAEVGMCCP
jgi:hypothetical protein